MNHSTAAPGRQAQDDGYVFEVGSLWDQLEDVKDRRDPRGVRWPLVTVLLFALLAKCGGEDTVHGIALWINLRIEWLNAALHLASRRNRQRQVSGPHATTYSRVLGRGFDSADLEARLREWHAAQPPAQRQLHVCLDGKRMRGSISADRPAGVYLLCAFAPCVGLVLFQAEIPSGGNELSLAPTVLSALDLQGKIVSGDALFAQQRLSLQIVRAGGNYLWKVKQNQPSLLADIERHFTELPQRAGWSAPRFDLRVARAVDKAHGRIERRTLTASRDLAGYLQWPGAQQVFQYDCEVTTVRTGQRTRSLSYGLTSLPAAHADASRLLQLVRAHWGIESQLHARRDVTLHEDACHLRIGNAAPVMAALNNLVVSRLLSLGRNLPDLRRLLNAQPVRALNLLRLRPD